MNLRLAAAHVAPVFMDTAASVEKAISFVEAAGRDSVDLLVFPEVFLPGYPYFIDCYPPRPVDKFIAQYQSQSVEWNGEEIKAISDAARRANVAVVMGISERLAQSRTCFNSQVFIDRNGVIIGLHRKLQPTYAERFVWGQGGGMTLGAFDSSIGRIGGLVCGEHYMNLARHALIEDDEQVHAASWPALSTLSGLENTIDSQIEAVMKTHALTAQVPVVCAASPLDQRTVDWMERNIGPQSDAKIGGGWSAIIHPMTTYIASPHTGIQEQLVCGDFDMDDVHRARVWFDSRGHYSRPEVLAMSVDRRPLWHDEKGQGKSMPMQALLTLQKDLDSPEAGKTMLQPSASRVNI